MKNLNKTIFTATLLTSFFLGQPVLAGEEAEHDEYSGHSAKNPTSNTHMHRVTKGVITKEEHEANHKLLYGGKHRNEDATDVIQETTYTPEEQAAIHKLLFSGPDK